MKEYIFKLLLLLLLNFIFNLLDLNEYFLTKFPNYSINKKLIFSYISIIV